MDSSKGTMVADSARPGASLVFVGPLPPPVHGQAMTTAFLAERVDAGTFRQRRIVDLGGGGRPLARAWAHLRTLAALLAVRRRGGSRHFYLSVSANLGMYLNVPLVALGRLLGYRIVLHHHTAGHLERSYRAMRWLAAVAGADATHVSVCARLSRSLRRRYPAVRRTLELSNIVTLDIPPPRSPSPTAEELVLGLLSNLTFEKGVGRAVDTVLALRRTGRAARLLLAGPCHDPEAARFIEEQTRAHPDAITYLGPVYDADKRAFFDAVDVFVFPTRYIHETQGIVALEALAHGVPVIAYRRGCIPDDLQGEACATFDVTEDFARLASTQLQTLADDPQLRRRLAVAARERYDLLRTRAGAELRALLAELGTAVG